MDAQVLMKGHWVKNSSRDAAVRSPGMADVARLAGVSSQTVSRVLSGKPNVRAETHAKVIAAVDRLGYRRNNAARVLSSGRSRTLGVVTLQTTFYSRTMVTMGIERAAQDNGYAVSTATAASLDSSAIESALQRLADQQVEGVILAVPLIHVSKRIEQLTSAVPTIAIDGSRTTTTEVVAVDQVSAGHLATQHLLELGHETVWHVAGHSDWLDASSRSEGWEAALDAAGRVVPPRLQGDWSPASGYSNGVILARIPDVTAVFVASDEMAFGVIRALYDLGRRVPEDISVIGVDDIALASYYFPPLTTIAQPFARMGGLAVSHLLRCIDNPVAGGAPERIEPTLIVRASTGSPRPR